jgi:DNA repair exonuclease SbcCD ATPase subunit
MKLQDLEQEIRNTGMTLSMRGANTRRIGAKELELETLLRRQMELESVESTAQRTSAALEKAMKDGKSLAQIEDAVEADAAVTSMNKALFEAQAKLVETQASTVGEHNPQLEAMKATVEALGKTLHEARDSRQHVLSERMNADLKRRVDEARQSADQVQKRIEGLKDDLGQLNNALTKYQDDLELQRAWKQRMEKLNSELDLIGATLSVREANQATKPAEKG